jgi:uncharacterized membrane protein YgaE (UPF0421/DUF939 family)
MKRLYLLVEELIKLTLGPRVLKTGIAVALALYICSIFNLESAVFAGVAAIFTIQPSIYRTWKQVWEQIQTNTLGALIAFAALYFVGNDPFAIGLVMIVVIMISLKLKMAETISLTLVTVLAIMSAPGNEDLSFALHRFGIILIGMTSALLVNILIAPPKYKKNYLEKVQGVFQNMSILMRTAISNEMTEKSFHDEMKTLEKDLLKLEELYRLFDEEREKMAKINNMDLREVVVFKQMLKSVQQGFIVLESIDDFYFQSKPTADENLLFDQHLEHLIKYHELFLLKYNRKIKIDKHDEDIMNRTHLFLEKVIDTYQNNHDQKIHLAVIASSIYKYAFQIDRLNTIVEQYVKRGSNSKA